MLTPKLYDVDTLLAQGKTLNQALMGNLQLEIELPKGTDYNGELDFGHLILETQNGFYPFDIISTQGYALEDKYLLQCQFETNLEENESTLDVTIDQPLITFDDAYALLSKGEYDDTAKLSIELGSETDINVLNQVSSMKLMSLHDHFTRSVDWESALD